MSNHCGSKLNMAYVTKHYPVQWHMLYEDINLDGYSIDADVNKLSAEQRRGLPAQFFSFNYRRMADKEAAVLKRASCIVCGTPLGLLHEECVAKLTELERQRHGYIKQLLSLHEQLPKEAHCLIFEGAFR